jgi:undecaprenyl diphosphate synthase
VDYPIHVGIILDGNRRWAKERGLPSFKGHQAGMENIKKLIPYVIKKGVKYVSIYAFSCENFKRAEKEVKFLMDLFVSSFTNEFDDIIKENIKIVFSGRRDNLRKDVLKAIEGLTEKTKDNTNGVLNICLNYGGRQELVDAFKKLNKDGVDIDKVDDEMLKKYLYQDLPDLDYVIRTSGEERLSNFMLYQASYAELYFPKVYFPDFNEHEFDIAMEEYFNRQRRYGK